MHSSPHEVPDPTRIIELPVHMRPTTIAPSPASVFERQALARGSVPAPAMPTPNSALAATPLPSSPRDPADAFALLRRVYLQRDLTDAIAVLQAGLGRIL